jgi:replicative DNA helicase
MVLGSIILDDTFYQDVAAKIKPGYFHLDKHKKIYRRIQDMAERGMRIDRNTIADELIRFGELESVDGLSYLVSLDDGLPRLPKIDAYLDIIRDKYLLRRQVYIGDALMKQALSGTLMPMEVSRNAQAMLTEELGGFSGSPELLADYIANYPGGPQNMLDMSKRQQGIRTGFRQLDEWVNLLPGEILLIGASPGGGKTAWLVNVAKNLARRGEAGVIFSLEMSKEALLDRMICEEAYISLQDFRSGGLTARDRERLRTAANVVNELPIYIDDSADLTVADIRVSLMQMLAAGKPISWVGIDYAQLISKRRGVRFSNENETFSDIAEELRRTMKTLRLPLILTSQLTKDGQKDGQRPKLSDTYGSAAWMKICHAGACIYRESVQKPEREDLRDKALLLVGKNRSGPMGSIPLRYVGWLMRFENPPAEPAQTGAGED